MATTPTDRKTLLARRLRIDIDTATYPAVLYQMLRGVYQLNPVIESRTTEDEVYEDLGWMREFTTGGQWRLEISLKHSTDAEGASLDPVHAFLRERHWENINDEGLGEFGVRLYDRNGLDSGYEIEGRAYVKTWGRDGNATADPENLAIVIQGQGKPTRIPNPMASLVPVVTGLDPATGDADGGNLVQVYGTHLAGATAVTFGATEATDFDVISDALIVAIAPAHAAGTVQVAVTTPAGTSADVDADNYVYTA